MKLLQQEAKKFYPSKDRIKLWELNIIVKRDLNFSFKRANTLPKQAFREDVIDNRVSFKILFN